MKQITRTQAIEALRTKLLALADDEHSICDVAAQRGIYCHGFAQWSFGELKKRHPTIVRSRKAITPAELRELANRWQLARQEVRHEALACDAQMHEGPLQMCKGWGTWSTADLSRFYEEMTGEQVEVVADARAG
jgi:hypothetical protein